METTFAPSLERVRSDDAPLPRYKVIDTGAERGVVENRLNAAELLGYRVLYIIPGHKEYGPRVLMELASAAEDRAFIYGEDGRRV